MITHVVLDSNEGKVTLCGKDRLRLIVSDITLYQKHMKKFEFCQDCVDRASLHELAALDLEGDMGNQCGRCGRIIPVNEWHFRTDEEGTYCRGCA